MAENGTLLRSSTKRNRQAEEKKKKEIKVLPQTLNVHLFLNINTAQTNETSHTKNTIDVLKD